MVTSQCQCYHPVSPGSEMHHPQILIIFLILNWPGLAPGDSSPGNWWRLTLCPRHLIKYGNSPPLLLAPVCCVWEQMMNRCQRGSCDVRMVSGQAIVSCPPQFTIQVYENKVDIKVEKLSSPSPKSKVPKSRPK